MKVHLFYIPFTGLGLRNGYRGDKWLKQRIHIFKEYTLSSILNQTNQNFRLWFSWRPEERNNEIVQDFIDHLKMIDMAEPVHTFHGLCFWDDKYPDKQAAERLLYSLKKTLPELKPHCTEKEVLMTIQPSDDMYLSEAVETIQKTEFKGAAGWKKGYIMNYGTKEIYAYNTAGWQSDRVSQYRTDTIPPFFTIQFRREDFLDPLRHYNYTGPYRSHEHIAQHLPYREFDGRGFVVGTHGANISTVWNHRYKGERLSQEEQEMVTIETGTYFSEPIKVKKGLRSHLRNIVNVIPYNEKLRALYRSLPLTWQRL